VRNVLYRFYEKQLESGLRPSDMPRHIGVMVDGNGAGRKSRALIGHWATPQEPNE